ncbi:MAG: DUF421 domain-containing protein [Bacilli bacterium]|nr:DUF421 domain-containing protein [Bacilli bacterium]
MDLVSVIIRTIFFYIFVFILFRIMGKREVGQLSIQDLVVSLLIAELVAISIENYKDSILLTIIPIIILLFFELLVGYLSLKFNKFRNLVDGKPSLIINKGIINYKEMLKQRYNLDDLLLELRNNGIKNLKDVEYAILENNGKLNIFKYNFLDSKTTNPFPLILDGVIQKDTLNYIEKDEKWLNDYLYENKLDINEIFYSFYKNEKIYVIKRNEILR